MPATVPLTEVRFDVYSHGVPPNRAVWVRATHLPTGATATSVQHRTEFQAREQALLRLDRDLTDSDAAGVPQPATQPADIRPDTD